LLVVTRTHPANVPGVATETWGAGWPCRFPAGGGRFVGDGGRDAEGVGLPRREPEPERRPLADKFGGGRLETDRRRATVPVGTVVAEVERPVLGKRRTGYPARSPGEAANAEQVGRVCPYRDAIPRI
jgi:hypothetical protein